MADSQIYSKEKIPSFDELLDNLSDEEVSQLSNYTEQAEFVPGETIFYEDERGDALYIIQAGSVEISKLSSTEGQEYIPLITLKEGNVFGEMSFLSEGKTYAAAIANTHVNVFKITRNNFNHMVENHPQLACSIYQALCKILVYRLRRADEKAKKLTERK
ncbi:MAG: cyclic nucleotide-binding domain-containing protein [bacterium]